MNASDELQFGELVGERARAGLVERSWLTESSTTALESELWRNVLVTGKSVVGKTSEPLNTAFVNKIDAFIANGALSITAGLVAFVAGDRPDCVHEVRQLAARVVAAFAELKTLRRVDALSLRAPAPGLGQSIDHARRRAV